MTYKEILIQVEKSFNTYKKAFYIIKYSKDLQIIYKE